MTNAELIKKYQNECKVNATLYSCVDKTGKTVLLDGVINPYRLDNRQLCSPIDNQGTTSECAAFSACTIAESVYWKRTGKIIQLDADHVYSLAKQYDGDVNSDGTYLECALNALIDLHGFEKASKVELVYNDGSLNVIEQIRFLIHKYDIIQGGLNITDKWYDCDKQNYVIRPFGTPIGGHAIVICGYDQDGFYIANSWGKMWGATGFCVVPYAEFIREFMYAAYITNVYDNMN